MGYQHAAEQSTKSTSALLFPANKRIERLTEEEAWSLLGERKVAGEGGRDPAHSQLERLWFQNIAYYAGLTYEGYGEPFHEDFDFEARLEAAPYAANHIGAMLRREVARLSRARPQMEVTPNTSDQRDVFGAKVAKQVADWLYHYLDLEQVREELALWITNCGTAFVYEGWDHRAGKKRRVYTDPFSGAVVPAEQVPEGRRALLDQLKLYQDVADGDFDVEVLSPFQVRVPVGPTKWEKMPWATFTRLMSLDEVWERWPERAKDVDLTETSSASLDGYYWRRLATLISSIGHSFPTRGTTWFDGIEVHEHVIPPGGRWPNGAYVVGTNTVLLHNGPHPMAERGCDVRMPARDFHYMRQPGRFHSKSLTEDLIGPQEDYNIGRQQGIAQRDVLGKPQWLAPKQANLTVTRNVAGDLWEYDVAQSPVPPALQNPPSLSTAVTQLREYALDDMQRIAAQSDVTQARTPSGVRSGVAIRMLQEKDEMAQSGILGSMERGFRRLMTDLLKMFSYFVNAPRAIEIYGSSRQADVTFFRGSDLNGNTSVIVQPGSMMPKSKAAAQQTFLDALQAGFLDPMDPDVRAMGFEVLEFSGIDRAILLLNGHRRRADIENTMFLQPGSSPAFAFPDVDDDDDPVAHLQVHLAFKVTDDYERMPTIRKLAFDAHINKHYAQVARAQETQMLMSASAPPQGSPPKQPGTASQPRPREDQPQEQAG